MNIPEKDIDDASEESLSKFYAPYRLENQTMNNNSKKPSLSEWINNRLSENEKEIQELVDNKLQYSDQYTKLFHQQIILLEIKEQFGTPSLSEGEVYYRKCDNCEGSGIVVMEVYEPECCMKSNADGSCCGNAVPKGVPTKFQCEKCAAVGFIPITLQSNISEEEIREKIKEAFDPFVYKLRCNHGFTEDEVIKAVKSALQLKEKVNT